MELAPSAQFYRELPAHRLGPSEVFADPKHFVELPEDWHVVVTDVEGSTAHVANGRHEVINLVATASVIAALNIAHTYGVEIPFFFGGDGATILLPNELLEPVNLALLEHRRSTQVNFDMHLRVGSIPISEVVRDGHAIRLAKIYRNDAFSIPVVIGDGLAEAEKRVKAETVADASEASGEALDLDGMECRWDRVAPPDSAEEVVCLLVDINNVGAPASAIRAVLELIDEAYGPRESRNPISSNKLHLDAGFASINKETRAKLGRFDWRYFVEHWFRTAIIGPAFMRFADDGKAYVSSVPELSETLTIDGRISTVISGTRAQRKNLVAALEKLETAGEIQFGLHTSPASIMSCYVRNRHDAHIHFVDGADGGYTLAARMLKAKRA